MSKNTNQIATRVDDDLMDRIKAQCEKEHRPSIANFIKNVILVYLDSINS